MGKELTVNDVEGSVIEFDNDDDTRTVSETVIEAVATAAGDDPLEIEPLHSVVDPDALNAIFSRKLNGVEREGDVSVSFSFHGYEVTLWSYGRIHLSENGGYPGEV